MPERRSRLGDAERGALLVLVGAVVLANVGLRLLTDLNPWLRILLSFVVGLAAAAVVVRLVARRR